MSTARNEPTTRTRAIVTVVVFVVLAIGVGIGVWALITASSSSPQGAPSASPTPTSTSAGFIYTSGEYGYSVEFPSEPAENSSTVPVGDSQVPVTSAVWEGGTRSLVSTGAAYPAGALADVTTSLKSSLDGIVANTAGAQLVSSDPITLAGIPAVEASISVPSGNLVVVIAIDGDIQYQLVAAGFDKATADGFFASFRPA